ncbi:MAG: 12-oxophytodienoate reductase, partial [Bryobacteraceae bacterium]
MIRSTAALFTPFTIRNLTLANRIVMAPMTRSCSPGGVPGPDVAAYYRRRAEGGVGLIVTEGTYIPHPTSGFDPNVPRMYGDDSLAGWRAVAEQVHSAGGRIFSQLWHVGMQLSGGQEPRDGIVPVGPESMTQAEIDAVIAVYGEAAHAAQQVGFDGVELHGAHGYLIDQFFWEHTNRRTDRYGGNTVARTRFATEVIQEVRRRVGAD